jgi:hypothetical protein
VPETEQVSLEAEAEDGPSANPDDKSVETLSKTDET